VTAGALVGNVSGLGDRTMQLNADTRELLDLYSTRVWDVQELDIPAHAIVFCDVTTRRRLLAVDSREQSPLIFTRLESKVATLVTGDYGILGVERAAAIERKSFDDIVMCCGPERERFERELMRMRGYPLRRLVIGAPARISRRIVTGRR
jgi:hypothetical protein